MPEPTGWTVDRNAADRNPLARCHGGHVGSGHQAGLLPTSDARFSGSQKTCSHPHGLATHDKGSRQASTITDSASGDEDPVFGLFDAFDVSLERTSAGLPDTSKIRRSRCDRFVAPCKDWLREVPIPTRRSMSDRGVHRLDGRFSRGLQKGCWLEVFTPCWMFIWTPAAPEWGHEESRDASDQILRLRRSPPFTSTPSRLCFQCWNIRVVGGVGAGRSSMSAGLVEACGCGRARSGPKTQKRSRC